MIKSIQMRKISCLMLAALLFSVMSSAQKREITKKNPDVPVFMNTATQKNVRVSPPGSASVAPINRTAPAAKKTFARKHTPDTGKFKKIESHQIPITSGRIRPGMPTHRTFDVYAPTKAPVKSRVTQRRKLDYTFIQLNSQSDVDDFNTTYPNCESVGTLIFNGATINDVSPLADIISADALIIKNTSLIDLTDFTNMTTINDSLVIDNNSSLGSLGFANVSTLGGLTIRDCAALQDVDGFSSALESIEGDVVIRNSGVTSLLGLSNVISIRGDLLLQGLPIENLADLANLSDVEYLRFSNNPSLEELGLENITDMSGFLFTDLPALTNLDGLTENLNSGLIGTFWVMDMPSLNSLSGLSGLANVMNFYIDNCSSLTDLNGLQNLIYANYGISIRFNSSLTSLSGLDGLLAVAYGTIEIEYNSGLMDLNGLQSL